MPQPLLFVAWTDKKRPPIRATVLEETFEKLVTAITEKNLIMAALLNLKLPDEDSDLQLRLENICLKIEALGETVGVVAQEFGWKGTASAPTA